MPQSFSSAGISDMGGYGGGGSLPVNGLTAHQSQVGASSFSRNTAVAAEAAVACMYSLKTDSSSSTLVSIDDGEAYLCANGGSCFSRC